ncbi:hypothetical protein CV093_16605 [Oceanobacillus sp. 143]|uniref:Uncharacterized protein n=1 Tax=Oceanobacillus zhaokaii TaxID=2052660 RepID=A0A345PJT5_9BACI|nr:hypothetical protein [Oceanobacillus zhaokaii]AXI10265.1 hypothetical protein CUC15_15585 [Oceanobacillus zhaokaii]QGS69330.1 hypothetical protein CV093_16605 [Oceanobacillus sp. 143]
MRKYLILFMLFAIICVFNMHMIYDSPQHHQVVVVDEGEKIQTNHAVSFDPIDAEKQKLALVKFNIAIFLALFVTYVIYHFFTRIRMRCRLCIPMFFQSNYVITSPFAKII